MALSNRSPDLERREFASPIRDSRSTPRKTASGNSSIILRSIQRSDQKLWPFRTGTLVWNDKTSASTSSDSTSAPTKTASENSSIILRSIQWSNQKLGPFRSGTLVWRDETSVSPSSNSTSTPRKPASENSSIILRVIQLRIKSYSSSEPVLSSVATRPPPRQVVFPHLLQGKQHPVTLL